MRRSVTKYVVVIAIFFAGIGCGAASAQIHASHMQIALNDLQMARYQLNLAPLDNAGHRGSALGMLDGAIEQVRLAITAR
jgi:hypothetical protein